MLRKVIFISFIVCMSLQGADDTLSSKIAKLQTMPKSERYKLMNEIKRELAKLNSEQRSVALGKLRRSLNKGSNFQSGTKGGIHSQENPGMHGAGMDSENKERMYNMQINREFQKQQNINNKERPQNRPGTQDMKHRK